MRGNDRHKALNYNVHRLTNDMTAVADMAEMADIARTVTKGKATSDAIPQDGCSIDVLSAIKAEKSFITLNTLFFLKRLSASQLVKYESLNCYTIHEWLSMSVQRPTVVYSGERFKIIISSI